MQNKILLATTNSDKVKMVRGILNSLDGSIEIISLADYGIKGGDDEQGSLIERARHKAVMAIQQLNDEQLKETPFVIGMDDGIVIDRFNEDKEDSKTVTGRILTDPAMVIGDTITVERAISIIQANNVMSIGARREMIIKIKFDYKGNPAGVGLSDGYPLSQVLAYKGSPVVISQLSDSKVNMFNKKYHTKFIGVVNRLIELTCSKNNKNG